MVWIAAVAILLWFTLAIPAKIALLRVHGGEGRRAERRLEGREAAPEAERVRGRDDHVEPDGVELHEGEVGQYNGDGGQIDAAEGYGEDAGDELGREARDDGGG